MIVLRLNGRLRAALLAVGCSVLVTASAPPEAAPLGFRNGGRQDGVGAHTRGGLQPGTHVLHVTTLDDSGPGSLRDALGFAAPRVIVFDVSGVIRLESQLKVVDPFLTIAGETAPAPGITLIGAPLIISTHDVIVEHLAIRPGPPRDPSLANLQDGVTVIGSKDGSRLATDVLLRNLSISWAVDKGVTLWRSDVSKKGDAGEESETAQVTIKDCIISENLDDAGHPKGEHSMGLLIGRRVQGVEVRGTLFAHNRWRNPVIHSGAQAYVVNNLIYDPGNTAIHFYTQFAEDGPIQAAVVNNIVAPGPSSKPGLIAIKIPPGPDLDAPGTAIFLSGNVLGRREDPGSPSGPGMARQNPLRGVDPPLPAASVHDDVLKFAGARPGQRDAVDARIVREVDAGRGRIIDDIGDRASELPRDGHVLASHPPADVGALGRWLCQKRQDVGARPEACGG